MIGVGIPQAYPSESDISRRVLSFLRCAESAGYASAWVAEAPLSRPSLDPLAVLAVAATHTSRMRLGSAVLVLPDYRPELLARTVASIDRLSDGRLSLGVGIGEPGTPPDVSAGPPRSRGERFEDAIALVRDTRPSVPVYVGARAPIALRRAARLGDGWICSAWADHNRFVDQKTVLLDRLHGLGRDPKRFRLVKRCYVAVDQRVEDVDAWFGLVSGGPAPAGDVVVRGDADHVEERLQALHRAGAEDVIVQFVGRDEHRQLAALADHGTVERLSVASAATSEVG